MKRYKLLQDLPGHRKGEIVTEGQLVLESADEDWSTSTVALTTFPDWFEEIKEPESQEGRSYSPADEVRPCGCAGRKVCINCPKPQEKEECKHDPKFAFSCSKCGDSSYGDAPQPKQDCSHKNVVSWCGDCENVISPQEQSPSEWIAERADDIYYAGGAHKTIDQQFIQAILDFLDSVAAGKYKL